MRLRTRLVLAYLLPTLALLAAFAWLAHRLARDILEQELGGRLVGLARAGAALVPPEVVPALAPGEEQGRTYANVRRRLARLREAGRAAAVFLFDRERRVLCDDAGRVPIGTRRDRLDLDRAELDRVWAGGDAHSLLFRGPDGRWLKTGYAPVAAPDGTVVAAVGVDGSADFFTRLGTLRAGLVSAASLLALLLVGVSAAVARRITRPVAELEAAARRIGGGDLGTPVATRSGGELGLFARTLEEMRGALGARDQELQMMLAGIAHEVRNPLGAMELWCGLLREALREQPERLAEVRRIEQELAHLSRVVGDFLEFARRAPPELREAEAAALVRETRELCAPEAEAAGVELAAGAPAGLTARCDAAALRRALVNLTRNAVQATPRGGRVRIACARDGAAALFTVSDTGCGIPADRLAQVFRPFYTTREKGTGLGLAFVQRIAHHHRGAVELDSVPGRGTTVRLRIPSGS